jgi:hypothetical protein
MGPITFMLHKSPSLQLVPQPSPIKKSLILPPSVQQPRSGRCDLRSANQTNTPPSLLSGPSDPWEPGAQENLSIIIIPSPRFAAAAASDTSSTMGASSSTGTHEQESLASAALALSLLHATHSRSAASANVLPDILIPPCAAFHLFGSSPPAHLDVLLVRLGPAVASHFFGHREGANAGRLGFLKGFNRCCACAGRRRSRSRSSSACTPWPAPTPGRPAACSSSRATAVTTPWPNHRRAPRCLLLLDSIDLLFAGASKSPPSSPFLSSLRAPRVVTRAVSCR